MNEQTNNLLQFLDSKVAIYNQPDFIADDPISIPHQFTKKQDIEIAGFFAAILAWGNRKSIINSCNKLLTAMDHSPHDFILHHTPKALKRLEYFVHRTFNSTDLFWLIEFFRHHYQNNDSLETAFSQWMQPEDDNVEQALNGFHHYVFSSAIAADYPERTKKHIAAPFKKSACKRLNMYLRWMIRKDNHGVDFGLWNNITPAQLICPLDVHVARVARRFNLLERQQNDWQTAVELTAYLKQLDPIDPVKYDFALFGLGVVEKY
jgi:uncharacterized protein (TIGR02757 family)